MDDDQGSQEWLRRVHGDGERGLAAAFEHYRRRMRNVIDVRMGAALKRRLDPSDVLQDVFLDARRCLPTYVDVGNASVFVWLRDLVLKRLSNTWRDHVRAEKRSLTRELTLPDRSSAALANLLLGQESTPSEGMMRREAIDRVRRALDRLPTNDQEIIVLRYFERLTNREAAEVLEIADSAATMRHGRALDRLRKLLKDPGEEV